MKIHEMIIIQADSNEDHQKIYDTLNECEVPFSKSGPNIYVLDMSRLSHLRVLAPVITLGGVEPIRNTNTISTKVNKIFGV